MNLFRQGFLTLLFLLLSASNSDAARFEVGELDGIKRTTTDPQVNPCDLDSCDPAKASRFNPMLFCRAKCASKSGCGWDSDEGCEWRGGSLLEKDRKRKKRNATSFKDPCDLDGCDPADSSRYNPMLICRAKCASKSGCGWDSDEGCESRGGSLLEKDRKRKKRNATSFKDPCDLDGCDPADSSRYNPMLICRAKCASKSGCGWDSDEGCESRGVAHCWRKIAKERRETQHHLKIHAILMAATLRILPGTTRC
eukprot:TRINITY_DN1702_c0_g1_i5.p1 TRINITY_DN1702_c0_g1~~TRINITY_DN1702_c0_g1_i5.p1  ORF type:complete len:253 (-),score=33.45 TRINITY_DN1702_c0_g1_i5:38-796(-)